MHDDAAAREGGGCAREKRGWDDDAGENVGVGCAFCGVYAHPGGGVRTDGVGGWGGWGGEMGEMAL